MKCPRCGNEMNLDSHRKITLQMCYNCGYIEGRNVDGNNKSATNFEHMKSLNFNEMAAFLAGSLGVDKQTVINWLDNPSE